MAEAINNDPVHRPGVCTGTAVDPRKHELARRMRSNMTPAERCFWNAVRHNRFLGLQFRRQQVIHGFIADFYCNDLSLIVEIDGGVHEQQQDYDRLRDHSIRYHGINVMRFTNDDVINRLEWVLECLKQKAQKHTSTVPPRTLSGREMGGV